MTSYVALLRAVNVGGTGKLPMTELRAMCESIAPKVFQLNDNRQSEAVNPAGDTEEKILEAAESCPVSAIFVEDAETGERLFP